MSGGKPIQYWRDRWNRSGNTNDYSRALDLFCEYSGGYNAPLGGVWFIGIGSFFKGRWKSHHQLAVKETINFHCSITRCDSGDEWRTLDVLLSDLEGNIKGAPIKPDGDLARILSVIQYNTGLVYGHLNQNNDDVNAGVHLL